MKRDRVPFKKSQHYSAWIRLPPTSRGTSLFLTGLWASIQFEFTYIQWNNRQMGFASVRSVNIVIKLQNWKLTYRCGLLLHNCNNIKILPCATYSGNKEKLFHQSTFVYTRLVIRLHSSSDDSSTFVCIRLWLVYTRLVTLSVFSE